jgi:hypothetical protein
MAHVKKGQLTASPEWRKHLREAKRWFWKRERLSGRAEGRTEAEAARTDGGERPAHAAPGQSE